MTPRLGELEQRVLLALLRLGHQAYGVAVQREIAARAGRTLSFATIYTTLGRLESKGLVAARLGEELYYVMEAPVLRVTGWSTPYPPAKAEGEHIPDVDRILDAVDRSLAF